MKTTKIEVIFSFKQIDQQIYRLEFDYRPSEAQFLFQALSLLSTVDRAELFKISACQLLKDDSEPALLWILESNGKYLFGVNLGK